MTKPKHPLGGIFFADDHVIISAASYDAGSSGYPAVTLQSEYGPLDFSTNPPVRIPSSTEPVDDIERAIDELDGLTDLAALTSVAVAAPGPFANSQLDPASAHPVELIAGGYGVLSESARRPTWRGFQLYKALNQALEKRGATSPIIQCVVDVESFVFAEHYLYRKTFDFAGPGRDAVVYLLLDEGVGATAFKGNRLLRGDQHCELGHIPIGLHGQDQGKRPHCTAHRYACLESLVSLPAIERRWGIDRKDFAELPSNVRELQLTAFYIAEALAFLTLAYTPAVILLGGRLMENRDILSQTRLAYRARMASPDRDALYPDYPAQYNPTEFIKPWSFADTGVLGCLCHAYMGRPGKEVAQLRVK